MEVGNRKSRIGNRGGTSYWSRRSRLPILDSCARVAGADLLEDTRDDAGYCLDALREDREHEVAPVREDRPAHQVMDVVGVARLGPEARAWREPLPGETRVLELEILEWLCRCHVTEKKRQHLLRSC